MQTVQRIRCFKCFLQRASKFSLVRPNIVISKDKIFVRSLRENGRPLCNTAVRARKLCVLFLVVVVVVCMVRRSNCYHFNSSVSSCVFTAGGVLRWRPVGVSFGRDTTRATSKVPMKACTDQRPRPDGRRVSKKVPVLLASALKE